MNTIVNQNQIDSTIDFKLAPLFEFSLKSGIVFEIADQLKDSLKAKVFLTANQYETSSGILNLFQTECSFSLHKSKNLRGYCSGE